MVGRQHVAVGWMTSTALLSSAEVESWSDSLINECVNSSTSARVTGAIRVETVLEDDRGHGRLNVNAPVMIGKGS